MPRSEGWGPLRLDRGLEAQADARAAAAEQGAPTGPLTSAPTGAGALPNLEEKILQFGAKWLSTRTVKTVTKHIAKHARQVAGKAIHSVLTSGEGEILRQAESIRRIIADVIDEVEYAEKRSVGPNERAELEELVRAGIAIPLTVEGEVADESSD